MREISLREHLAELGWGFEYLSSSGDIARVGKFQGAACFEPFGALRRSFDGRRLPIHQALAPGTTIKFLSSLRFDVVPNPSLWRCVTHPCVGLMALVAFISIKLSGQNVTDFQNMPQLQGDVEMFANPPFSEFPFDQPLTVKGVDAFAVSLVDENGVRWTLPAASFATIKQITVLKA